MSAWPSPDRSHPRQVAGERDSLEAWVDFHRATLLMKCAGLESEQLVARACHPSTLSLLGLVRHMTEVEAWFHDFDGEPEGEWYSSEEDPDGCFNGVDPSRAEADRAAYQASVERARAAVEHRDLDEISPVPDDGRPVSLRWVEPACRTRAGIRDARDEALDPAAIQRFAAATQQDLHA